MSQPLNHQAVYDVAQGGYCVAYWSPSRNEWVTVTDATMTAQSARDEAHRLNQQGFQQAGAHKKDQQLRGFRA